MPKQWNVQKSQKNSKRTCKLKSRKKFTKSLFTSKIVWKKISTRKSRWQLKKSKLWNKLMNLVGCGIYVTSQWNWGSLNSTKYQVKDNATITQNRKRVQKNDNSQQKNKNKKKTVWPATILSSVDELERL